MTVGCSVCKCVRKLHLFTHQTLKSEKLPHRLDEQTVDAFQIVLDGNARYLGPVAASFSPQRGHGGSERPEAKPAVGLCLGLPKTEDAGH